MIVLAPVIGTTMAAVMGAILTASVQTVIAKRYPWFADNELRRAIRAYQEKSLQRFRDEQAAFAGRIRNAPDPVARAASPTRAAIVANLMSEPSTEQRHVLESEIDMQVPDSRLRAAWRRASAIIATGCRLVGAAARPRAMRPGAGPS